MFVLKMTFFEKYFSLCSVLVGVHSLGQDGTNFGLLRTEKSYSATFFGVQRKEGNNFSFVHLKCMSSSKTWA